MRVGYMTNGFGPLVGEGAGVTSVKDIRYLTMGDDEEILKKITGVGFKSIEVLEGNLTKYSSDLSVLKDMLQKYSAEMMSVCVGANFIYQDALEDEMFHMEQVAKAGQAVGVTYAALCGGAIRGKGIQDQDYCLLGKGLDMAAKVFAEYGIEASYHPHLGSMAEAPEQVDRLFAETSIKICPTWHTWQPAAGILSRLLKNIMTASPLFTLKDLDDNGFAPLGTGRLDIDGVLDFLKEKGYAGDYLVEVDATREIRCLPARPPMIF